MMRQRSEWFPFNHNSLLRIPSTRPAVYVFWSELKAKAVYVGKTDSAVGKRLRQHRNRSHNKILRVWIKHKPEDLRVCYFTAPSSQIPKLEKRLIHHLAPIANYTHKS